MKAYQFQSKPFFILNFVSLLLLFSWSNATTREYWDYLDHQTFIVLNQSLVEFHSIWRGFWAILSVRIADLIPLFLIGLFFYFDDVLFKNKHKMMGLIGFVTLLILMLLMREMMNLYVEYANLGRKSPTLVVDSALRLSSMYPGLGLKDMSAHSFPGDHAAVLFTWLGYCLFFARNRWRWLVFIIVLVFSMPRLMAGAHWFSDVMVGGVSVATMTLAFGLYTPLLNYINKTLGNVASKFLTK
ncbi:MAG: putative membrane protein [Candidatus Ruthia sp. Asou_11_S2]|nr:putative membrane protein [Candidatus Ruthia sp. Asou_11_S2]